MLPRLSALTTIPLSSVSIMTSSTSCMTSSFIASSFSGEVPLTGIPATALSNPGAAILTPVAAFTSLTWLNFAFLSLISANGFGSRRALIFVTIGSLRLPTTTVAPTFNDPSNNMTSTVLPNPFSSLTSNMVPFPNPSVSHSKHDSMNFCANPVMTIRSSGIPSPVFAEVGMIEICLA